MGNKGFNLLQPQAPPPTFWDKAYSWVVGTARVIIIIIEILVFGAFVSRFILDRQTKVLDEAIKVQEFRLRALESKEADFRSLQVKGTTYKTLWEVGSNYTPVLTEVNSYLPDNTTDLVVQVSDDVVLIRGFANLSSVSSLESSLKKSETFTNIEVFEVQEQSGETSGRGVFAVRAIIKKTNIRIL